MEQPSLLQQGITAARAKHKGEAYRLLRQVVDADPNNVEAWIWLGAVAPSLPEQAQAFEQAQALDPANERAAAGLRWSHARLTSATPPPVAPVLAAPAVPAPIEQAALPLTPAASPAPAPPSPPPADLTPGPAEVARPLPPLHRLDAVAPSAPPVVPPAPAAPPLGYAAPGDFTPEPGSAAAPAGAESTWDWTAPGEMSGLDVRLPWPPAAGETSALPPATTAEDQWFWRDGGVPMPPPISPAEASAPVLAAPLETTSVVIPPPAPVTVPPAPAPIAAVGGGGSGLLLFSGLILVLLLLGLAAFHTTLAAFGQVPGPEATVRNFLTAHLRGDYHTAAAYLTRDQAAAYEQVPTLGSLPPASTGAGLQIQVAPLAVEPARAEVLAVIQGSGGDRPWRFVLVHEQAGGPWVIQSAVGPGQ